MKSRNVRRGGLAAAILLASSLAVPVWAQDLTGPYLMSLNAFRNGEVNASPLDDKQLAVVYDGLEGRWTDLTRARAHSAEPKLVADECTKNFADIVATAPGSFTMKLHSKYKDRDLTYTYAAIGRFGTFAYSTEPAELLAYWNYNEETSLGIRFVALQRSNGVAQLYRPHPDILVMTGPHLEPLIYARCPK